MNKIHTIVQCYRVHRLDRMKAPFWVHTSLHISAAIRMASAQVFAPCCADVLGPASSCGAPGVCGSGVPTRMMLTWLATHHPCSSIAPAMPINKHLEVAIAGV